MRDVDLETAFVRNFIVRNKAERMLYELNSAKKRRDAVWRFAHGAELLIRPERIAFRSMKMTVDEAEKQIIALSGSRQCYVLSGSCEFCASGCEGMDGRRGHVASDRFDYCGYRELRGGLEEFFYDGPAVLICSENTAFVVTEFERGCTERFVLFGK